MNKESQHEGWLIKSPPTKRIWRARWRRRWFTLKQGEIPEQFCLEYYTDRNCRKLKGVIDLDQCEQVDCGLRLENRKQKFQYMFDIKTPKRTYYLAADSEADMRDWVNCICQVCHLHDTKQQADVLLPAEQRSLSTNNTTTSSLNSSSATAGPSACSSGTAMQSFNAELLRRHNASSGGTTDVIVDQPQPQRQTSMLSVSGGDCAAYVNTSDYSNRETLVCDSRLHQQVQAAVVQSSPSSPGAAVYLNSSIFQKQTEPLPTRLAVSTNGVVRRIPENLVLQQTPLAEAAASPSQAAVPCAMSCGGGGSVQPSPALSNASGPYIPISECYSGSPKYMLDNPSTPLNNLDPKFYDTPRSHSNNIGLNLTNDQSYSPKISNCGSVAPGTVATVVTAAVNNNKSVRSHRSDSDSESVFTDDDEWAHPLPLREHVERSARPSDSSMENESFVLTYAQRFSKMQEGGAAELLPPTTSAIEASPTSGSLQRLAKVLKNKNNLILDFKAGVEKTPRDLPQFSDTENTSPAIGPQDSNSVVLEDSYDIPRSHQLPPYHNMAQMHAKLLAATSPDVANPMATSTPNLMPTVLDGCSPASPAYVTAVPRTQTHCYTNAGPVKLTPAVALAAEGNVFRYDFNEQGELPPVNRQLKPKPSVAEDKDRPPEECAAKPPLATPPTQEAVVALASKFKAIRMQMAATAAAAAEQAVPKPPSVDRKLKPNAYRIGNSATLASPRRSGVTPLSMVLLPQSDGGIVGVDCVPYVLETHTLPRQPRATNYAAALQPQQQRSPGLNVQHQRTASAAAAVQLPPAPTQSLEHKLQYFDLDVANAPPISRQSMSVGNLHAHSNAGVAAAAANASSTSRLGLSADPSARVPVKSSVVYNSVDFVKTEAFKRIREERKKESEGSIGAVSHNSSGGGGGNK